MTGQGDLFSNVVRLDEMQDLVIGSKEPCSRCGCAEALNPHRMDRRKVAVLMDLAVFRKEKSPWVRVEEGRGLQAVRTGDWKTTSYRAGAHINRLLWFGLVEGRGGRTAEWRIDERGLRFLRGALSVPAKLLCTKGKVMYESIERVSLGDIKGVELDRKYWDAYPWSDFQLQEATP